MAGTKTRSPPIVASFHRPPSRSSIPTTPPTARGRASDALSLTGITQSAAVSNGRNVCAPFSSSVGGSKLGAAIVSVAVLRTVAGVRGASAHGALAPEVDHHRLQDESVRLVRLVREGNLLSRFQLDQQRGCVGGVVAVVIVDDDSLDGIAEHQSFRLLDREKAPGERGIARVPKRLDVPRILDLQDAPLAEDLEKPQQGNRMEMVDGRVDRK